MTAVLISIKPKWCELIARGKKTIEIRKTKPRIEPPFKVYIYCTKAKEKLIDVLKDGDNIYGETYRGKPAFIKVDEGSVCDMWGKRQKVIGEFVCYNISTYCTEFYPQKKQPIFEAVYEYNEEQDVWQSVLSNEDEYVKIFSRETCLKLDDLKDYLGIGENQFYGWHISDLVIYDKPKELSEFQVKTPPQSWRYVERKM